MTCPLHEDRRPSLHAYSDHWFCFGCRTGGTLYDLAGKLWGFETRGSEFRELRRRLERTFSEERSRAVTSRGLD